MTFFYNAAFFFMAMGFLPSFLVRTRQAESGRELFRQRLGVLPSSLKETVIGKRVIWIHAVSVGEVMAAEHFIRRLLQDCPGYHLVLTTVTPTGQEIAKKIKDPRVSVCYFPFDFSFSVKSFFRDLQPDCLLLMETEIWPNLITEAARAHVPIGILNARLSKKSAKNYSRFRGIFHPLFSRLEFVLAQTEEDARRFSEIGTAAENIHVLGNMKYDNVALEADPKALNKALRAKWRIDEEVPVLVAGSTHPGEAVILGRVLSKLRENHPDLKMIMAPRHVERSKEAASQMAGLGFKTVLATEKREGVEFDILILNQLGVLKEIYALADAVFVGGSMIPKRGGQNPIEPAAFRKAIVHGPHVFNFERVYQILNEEGGAMLARDESELAFALERILESPAEKERLGRNAYDAIVSLRGSTERHVRWLSDFLASETELVKG